MQFLVHIGVNKTGTSSLQRALNERRAALSEQGILYPATGIQFSAHHGISRVIQGGTPASQAMSDDWEDHLRAEFGDHELCILSSEHFATLKDPAPLARICPLGQTRVVVYLRDYVGYLVSWYQQAMQMRNITMSIDEYIEVHRVSFADIIKRWSRVYGRENVIVRLYDSDLLKNRDIVTDFCDVLRPGLETIFEGIARNSNPSLSGNLLFLKQILNHFISREEAFGVVFEVSSLSSLDPTFRGKLEVGPETIKRIRFLTREDAAAIRNETVLNLISSKTSVEGSASPDLDRLEADIMLIRDMATSRNFKIMDYLARMEPLVALAATPGGDLKQ